MLEIRKWCPSCQAITWWSFWNCRACGVKRCDLEAGQDLAPVEVVVREPVGGPHDWDFDLWIATEQYSTPPCRRCGTHAAFDGLDVGEDCPCGMATYYDGSDHYSWCPHYTPTGCKP